MKHRPPLYLRLPVVRRNVHALRPLVRGTLRLALPAVLALLAACTGLPADPPLSVVDPRAIISPAPSNDANRPVKTDAGSAGRNPSPPRELQRITSADQQAEVERRVTEWLAQEVGAERAVDIALINNPTLQVRLSELGIGLADLEQARRLPNPGFSFSRIRGDEGLDIERGLHFNLIRLLFYPQLRGIEERRFEQTRLLTLHDAQSLANRTRRAWYEAVAARQKVTYARQVMETADAAAELARRLEQVGNYSTLSRAREQAFSVDAKQNLTRALQQESASRVRLLRLMGLSPDTPALKLPGELPPLPVQLIEASAIRQVGISQRLDVQAARAEALRTADFLGLSRASRFITVFELGGIRETGPGGERKRGVEFDLQLPIFDSGDARVARAQATYERALQRVRAAVVEADGDVQLTLDTWQATWELARRQRDESVPLRQRIVQESLLRYNGMIGSVFELLAESRAQIASVSSYIDLLRDFWQADSDLGMALIGRPVLLPGTGAQPHGLTPEATPAAGGGHPGGH